MIFYKQKFGLPMGTSREMYCKYKIILYFSKHFFDIGYSVKNY